MRKFEKVFKAIAEVRSIARGETGKRIKRYIGDSTRNNRTLTVSQTVRYLDRTGLTNLAQAVGIVSEILETEILRRRENRTDAIDLTELVNTYRVVVMNGKSDTYRRRIGNALAKVG
jgi:hypothetical protein